MTAPYPRFDGTQACADSTDPEAAWCVDCPFLLACRQYALDHDVRGVWGGLDDADRRTERAALGLPPPIQVSDELDDLVIAWRRAAEAEDGA